ncbi:mannose-6-phosphate isomerase, class I [Catellatospora tritici]|uniref:mannose-6-phosphate isomerase, class I n=1 Tax=Catellatospora tritici TaxID=2851566 RepID=UPI001C2DADC7|nr:mannose-6-phosphate isomerase, class I [Catellatospora tritici]MBV1854461.1 mannose-6-phosphate isomerase, class I [Catellatospora tritici]
MFALRCAVRPYTWGSREFIAALQGRSVPSAGPEAELWIGAHPGDPSRDGTGRGLDELIARAPRALLGAAADRFGPRLPYLMKVLAAASPLSLQAHPDLARAQAGYAAEDAAGVALDSAARSYVDRNHKPELLVALTPFDALCGFRPGAQARELLMAVASPPLDGVLAALAAGGPVAAVGALLALPRDTAAEVVRHALARADRLPAAEAALLRRLDEAFPGDIGVLVALLLTHLTLAPGEGLWVPAGVMHAYVQGAGVEIMAAGDNVLRGGLTAKHVNVPELLAVLGDGCAAPVVIAPVEVDEGVTAWPAPVEDFALHRVTVADGRRELAPGGPRLVLCVAGEVVVTDGDGEVRLGSGEAAFVAAGPGLALSGTGTTFVASV